MVFPLFFAPIFTLTRWDEPDWLLHDWAPCDLPPRVQAAWVSPENVISIRISLRWACAGSEEKHHPFARSPWERLDKRT